MFIVMDVTTSTVIGPFDSEDAAVMWQMHASDEINDANQDLDIYQLTDPMEWMLDNFANPVEVEV